MYYFMTTVAPFAIKFQNQDLEKDQLPDAARPSSSNLLANVINDIVNFVVESSAEDVTTKYYYCVIFILSLKKLPPTRVRVAFLFIYFGYCQASFSHR